MSPDGVSPDGVSPDGELHDAEPAPVSGRRRLLGVAVVLLLEAVALLAFAAFLVANLVGGTDETASTTSTVIATVTFVVVAGLLAWLGLGCRRARRWVRAPVLVTQLIVVLGVGVPLLQGDVWYAFPLGIPLTVAAAAAVLVMLTPTVSAVLED